MERAIKLAFIDSIPLTEGLSADEKGTVIDELVKKRMQEMGIDFES